MTTSRMKLTAVSLRFGTNNAAERNILLKKQQEAEAGVDGNIYGVSWDLSATNRFTRTDAAADFPAPSPSVGGSRGSSPFDDILPWAGMKIVEDEYAGTLVSIPKFYYRIEHTGEALNIQITSKKQAGFHTSPAHADRGDGKGERNVVYIARYHMGGEMGQSVTNALPIANVTRAELRETIRAMEEQVGVSGYSLQDYAMFWTVRLLMLVEFATWDFQGAIGYGCGNGESAENTGSTDNMPYHTGTISESAETYAVGIQYRYIEDMWANVVEFIDGWRCAEAAAGDGSLDVYITLNPAEYSDTEGGVLVGNIPSTANGGFIKDWAVPSVKGYSWALCPAAIAGEDELTDGNEYVTDCCEFDGPALCSGGCFDGPSPLCGPFSLGGGVAEDSGPVAGARLQKIP